ncbi:hypothetical protein I302_105373 [Kwoniella bestiolae CBS 10118]|uniref:DNA repair protein RAD5 n=1 Tax=Kwoniella bestiolae CBS 10118 TaxID=1296100 RepID=A0A1B9FSX6_9TREE|nr:hypothetical protein I302_08655 [Kwoniella bestiolae CBS 10118]OCF21876.1 hypothetical protein I302_08655 [Kwoniella bestiolae CBS 10118]
MADDRSIEKLARKTLGLDEEPDKPTPQFYLDAFQAHVASFPDDTNFIIELADPKRKGGEIGGNGFGVITCMEDLCWNDVILAADPNKLEGGRQDGFGSFSNYQDHCMEPDHARARMQRCGRLGINNQRQPHQHLNSFSSFSLSSRPPNSFEYSSSSSSRPPLPLESSSSSSSTSKTGPSKPSILDNLSLAGPSSSSSMPPRAKPSRSSPTKWSTDNDNEVKPKLTSSSSSTRPSRKLPLDIISISSSSTPPGSDDENEFDELAEDSDDDDAVIPLSEDEIPDEYRKVTNKNDPILLTDSDDDEDMVIRDRGKGKAVARTSSNNSIPLAPIFTLSQSNRKAKTDVEGGVEMVRDDSGSSIGDKEKTFNDFLSKISKSSGRDKGKSKEDITEPGKVQALSSEEKIKMMMDEEKERKPTPVGGDHVPAPPNSNGRYNFGFLSLGKTNIAMLGVPAAPLPQYNGANLAYYELEAQYLRSPPVQVKCIQNHELSLLVNGRLRVLAILMVNRNVRREYFPPSPPLLTLLPDLRYRGPPSLVTLANGIAGPSTQPGANAVVNGQHNGYAGLNMPGAWNAGPVPGLGAPHQLAGMIGLGDDDDDDNMAMRDIYGGMQEWDRPRTDEGLHTFFDENLKDFIEDTTVEESLNRLGLNSMDDRLPDLKIKLMAHQILGVDFMIEKEKDKKYLGGINADAMGLGKTVQSIATIACHRSEDQKVKTTLIIAPLALLHQWKNEIEAKTTPGFLRVLIYHGPKRVKSKHNLKQYDVVLTTYGTLVAESGPKEKRKKAGSDDEEDYADVKKQGPLFGVHWWRVILDEAHQIRNKNTRATKACWALKSHLRWCLTGTPIVNTLDDMYPYLHFLSISPAARWEHFRGHISQVQKRRPKLATKRMQALIRPCCIRRNKDSELNGQKLLQLKPKHTNVVELSFTDDERQIYTAIEGRFQVRFNSYLKKGTVMKHYSVVLVMLLRLRQLTCHPWLLRRNPNDGAHDQDVLVSDEDLMSGVDAVKTDDIAEVARAKTLLGDEVVQQMKKKLTERQAKINDAASDDTEVSREEECPICNDVFTDERITPCLHSFCAPCLQDVFNSAANNADLSDADINAGRRACPMCRGPIEKGRVFRAEAFMEHDKEDEESDMAEEDGVEGDIEAKLEENNEEEYEEGDRKGKRKANGDVKPRLVKKKKTQPKGEDPLADVADELAMEDVPPSTKMKKLGDLIDEINKKDPTDKIIVFSQFVQFIELCSLYLTRKGINHVRYIGSMKQDEREKVLKDFGESLKDKPNSPKVILMSLKCGGVGLNLCAANHVICMDLAWNAATENQAVDRAHRIGQDKEVHVHRLVIENTVEQRIMTLQEEKQALSDGAMGEGAAGRLGRLSVRDLMRLFAVGGDGED